MDMDIGGLHTVAESLLGAKALQIQRDCWTTLGLSSFQKQNARGPFLALVVS